MKKLSLISISLIALSTACTTKKSEPAETATVSETPVEATAPKHLFIDVHNLEPGKVKFEDVAGAHQKDLATQGKYGVSFIKFWVDESAGKVYCLSESPDSVSIYNTHKEAHGLTPALVEQVTDGAAAAMKNNQDLFLDIHELGAGKVTAAAVADAHVKDLAVQGKYGVNLINYWVDEKTGVVMCLAEAKNSQALIDTHKEAHGLIPKEVLKVKQGE